MVRPGVPTTDIDAAACEGMTTPANETEVNRAAAKASGRSVINGITVSDTQSDEIAVEMMLRLGNAKALTKNPPRIFFICQLPPPFAVSR